MTHHRVTLAAIALTLMAATGAAAQDTGFGAGTPESRYFRVDATVTAGRRGPQLEGYVYNVYDAHATRVRLNVEAPLPAGTTTARVSVLNFEWVPRGAGGGGM